MLRREIVATLVVFMLGALAWVLPPHVMGRIVERYPGTTWGWLGDGISNIQPSLSVPIIVIIGIVYGFMNPRWFAIAFIATFWILPFNIALDISNNPSSHNLFPFELVIFAFYNLPSFVGAWIGRFLNTKYV